MTAQPLDYAAIQAEHATHVENPRGGCTPGHGEEWPRCLPYRLAVEAERLAGKVARVQAWRDENTRGGWVEQPVEGLDAALSDDPETYLEELGFHNA